jgi:hypothetical protein
MIHGEIKTEARGGGVRSSFSNRMGITAGKKYLCMARTGQTENENKNNYFPSSTVQTKFIAIQ